MVEEHKGRDYSHLDLAATIRKSMEEIDIDTQQSRDDRFVRLVKQGLDEYHVMVWNGEAQPVKKPIGDALTLISYDVRGLKEQVKENSDLLTGTRQRKKLLDGVAGFMASVKNSSFIKIIGGIVIVLTAVPGAITWLDKLGITEAVKGWFK